MPNRPAAAAAATAGTSSAAPACAPTPSTGGAGRSPAHAALDDRRRRRPLLEVREAAAPPRERASARRSAPPAPSTPIRRALCRPLPADTILDDVLTPMRVVLAGYRVVFNERARAFDRAAADADAEARRKIRTLAGNYQILSLEPRLLLPWRNPVWLQYVSHKLGRLVVPYALLAIFCASIVLAGRSLFYAARRSRPGAASTCSPAPARCSSSWRAAATSAPMPAASSPAPAAGRSGDRVMRRLAAKAARVAFTFVMMNYAAVAGLFAAARGQPGLEVGTRGMERLTFNIGPSRGRPTGRRPAAISAPARDERRPAPVGSTRRRRASASATTGTTSGCSRSRRCCSSGRRIRFPASTSLHLAELTAIAGLAAMAVRRMSAGQTIAHVNAEVIGVVVLGAIIVLTRAVLDLAGRVAAHVFSDIYVKIILIFALMMSTITSPRRVRQMTWIMIVASGYIAARAVFDYVRGVNLVEGDRVRGAVGGMFENPNDLALNLVTFLAPTLFIILHDRKPSRRLFACGLAAVDARRDRLHQVAQRLPRPGRHGRSSSCYYTAQAKPAVGRRGDRWRAHGAAGDARRRSGTAWTAS